MATLNLIQLQFNPIVLRKAPECKRVRISQLLSSIHLILCIVVDIFYAPSFEEVEGTYWFGPLCPSVHPSVHLSVTLFGS